MLHKIGDHYINLDGLAHVWVNPKPAPEQRGEVTGLSLRREAHVALRWQGDAKLALYDADAQQVIALLDEEIKTPNVDEAAAAYMKAAIANFVRTIKPHEDSVKWKREPDVPAQYVSEA
jgi:hypothetical protein